MATCTTSSFTLTAVPTAANVRRGRWVTVCTMVTGRVTKENAAASVEDSGICGWNPLAVNSPGAAARAARNCAASVFTSSDSGAITATIPSSRVTFRGSSKGNVTSPAGLSRDWLAVTLTVKSPSSFLVKYTVSVSSARGRGNLEPLHRLRVNLVDLKPGRQAVRQGKDARPRDLIPELAARGQPRLLQRHRKVAVHDDPRLQLRGDHRQLVVGREELVKGAARSAQRRRNLGRIDARDRFPRDVFQAHVLGAADGQDPALPGHADRTDLPHLERLFGNGRLGVQFQADRLRGRGVQPHFHPLAVAGRLGLPIAQAGRLHVQQTPGRTGLRRSVRPATRAGSDSRHAPCVWTTPSPTSTAIVSVTLARPAAFSEPPDFGLPTDGELVGGSQDRAAREWHPSGRTRSSKVRCGATCTARSFSGISSSRLLTPTAGHCTVKLRPSAVDFTPVTRVTTTIRKIPYKISEYFDIHRSIFHLPIR